MDITLLPPTTPEQEVFRIMIKERNKHIIGPHCEICGDQKKLVSLNSNKGLLHLCEFCYNIQFPTDKLCE